jgi:alginate biosynthesis protein AlgX
MTGQMVKEIMCGARARIAAVMLALCGAPFAAQGSEFACFGLMNSATIPSVEGSGGMFYLTSPDLMMSHEITRENAEDLARLSDALAAQGTTLIYVPTPTKALGQPQNLPWSALDLGYDADIAATVYDKNIERLRRHRVRAFNARHVLARAAAEAPVYYGPDPRLNLHGMRVLAQAVAKGITESLSYASLPKSVFLTGVSGKVPMHSDMRLDLQEHCQKDLPVLVRDQVLMRQGSAPQDLFSGANPMQVAVVSSATLGEGAQGFTHHLQEATGLSVGQYSLATGGSLAAMTAYLTSPQFQENRPAFLIWEQPVWQNPGEFGDQPMQELITAAGPRCEVPLPLQYNKERKLYQADLSRLDQAKPYTLYFDNDGVQAWAARFIFTDKAKQVRARTIYRSQDQVLAGRFYMPMSGSWPDGASHVDIQLGGSYGRSPTLTACLKKEAS